jgi:hypothetical protein
VAKRKTNTDKQKAWAAFSKYVRRRDALRTTGTEEYARCITCGNVSEITEMDAGHWIPRNKLGTFMDERNVHAQCRGCNRFAGGRPAEYAEALIQLYGPEELEALVRQSMRCYKIRSWDEWEALYKRRPPESTDNPWREG